MSMMESSPPPLPSSAPSARRKMALIELMYLARQWQPAEDPPLYSFWMASSEVDQKFLGHYAKATHADNNYLSSFLFRVLGLSVILSEKLIRTRKARRLDPVRDLKARQLIHQILWLAREGLIMVEQYILPMVGNYAELKVLSYKLRASFYHIFVLFHNDPPVNNRVNRGRSASNSSVGTYTLFPDPLAPKGAGSRSQSSREAIRSPSGRKRSPAISLGGALTNNPKANANPPPGLDVPKPFSTNPYSTIQPNGASGSYRLASDPSAATHLIPLADYTPHATAAFKAAATLADDLLPGSHPVALSVKVEYVAYVYDCLKEFDRSRKMAKMAIRSVYESTAGMDDESFEDAAELVSILGRMMKRGLGAAGSSVGGSESQLGNPGVNVHVNSTVNERRGVNPTTSNPGTISPNERLKTSARPPGQSQGHARIRSNSSDIFGAVAALDNTGPMSRSQQRTTPAQQPTTWV